jgi:hypothetical protein
MSRSVNAYISSYTAAAPSEKMKSDVGRMKRMPFNAEPLGRDDSTTHLWVCGKGLDLAPSERCRVRREVACWH